MTPILLDDLESRLQALEAKAGSSSLITHITTFAPEPFELSKPIEVVIQPTGDDYVASFFDANVNATGCNPSDAFANLRELILSRFEFLGGLPPERLGKGPARQLAVLQAFIQRRG